MVSNVIENFVLGFVISAIPGAVFFETIRRAIRSNAEVLIFLLGNFSGMLVIIVASFIGLSAGSTSDGNARLFYCVSGALLCYIGVSAILSKYKKPKNIHTNAVRASYSAYATGFVLAMANPISVAFWLSLSANVLHETTSLLMAVISCLSVLAGAAVLFLTLIWVVRYANLNLETKQTLLISRVIGVILLCYGFASLYKGIVL